jgi:hypothetical protein
MLIRVAAIVILSAGLVLPHSALADEPAAAPKAFIDGQGPDWKPLTLADFDNFNGHEDTWSEKEGIIHCTGQPVGIARSKKKVGNFEMVLEWRHLRRSGNSGVFCWAPDSAFTDLKPGQLPRGGIEVQILDHGYAEDWEKSKGSKSDWFTTNGDVFPVGSSKMKPFAPVSANGSRSFPRKETTKGSPDWNHYYIRGINGEIRLWVNGEEVSGGANCEPREGYLCLESEGSPVEFKNIRIRELP